MLKTMQVVGVVLSVLGATSASAHGARLLAPEDLAGASASAPAVSLTPSAASLRSAPASLWLLRGATAGVGMASVPVSLWLAGAVGNLSNGLIATAVPALLIMGLLAPTITALVSWVMANTNLPEGQRVGFWLPWLGATLLHVGLLVAGAFLGLSVGSPFGLLAFSAIDGFAMSFAATGIQQLAGRSAQAVSTLETHAPHEAMTFVPLSRVAF